MKKELKELVGKNKIKEVLDRLYNCPETEDDALILKARWSALQEKINMGTISTESASLIRNQIVSSIQDTIKGIKDTPNNQSPIQNDQEEMTPLQRVNDVFAGLEKMKEDLSYNRSDIRDSVMWLSKYFNLAELEATVESWGLRTHLLLPTAERAQIMVDVVDALLGEKKDFVAAARAMTVESQNTVSWEELWNLAFKLKTKEAWGNARDAVKARLKAATFSEDQQDYFDRLAKEIDDITAGPLMWGYKFSSINGDIINWVNKNLRG